MFLALQLESDDPEYDMDRTDHEWFNECGRVSCPNLTHLAYEIIIDKLENASTRTLISYDEARTLLSNIDETHLKSVYDFWHKRRTARVHFIFKLIFSRKININILDFKYKI